MIKFTDLYCVLSAVVPLYVTMFLAYASVKYWQVFTPDQCSGINRFVAIFAVPLLSFEFISRINPYKAEFLFIAADVASKLMVLSALFCWAKFSRRGSIDWLITNYSLATLPNTLVMGIPLLKSMYGDDKEGLMIQAVVMQSLIWYTLLLFLFEYRAARIVIMQKLNGGKTEKGAEKAEIHKVGGGSEEEMVHVIVARPTTPPLAAAINLEPLDSEQQKLQNAEKMGPGSARLKAAEEDGFCEQSVQVCNKEEENGAEKADNEEKIDSLNPADNSSSMSLGMVMRIMKMVCFRLLRNPNSYVSVFGLTWALISGR
ncbi:hypothetical protein ACLOJK_032386 [Asimina triloba]